MKRAPILTHGPEETQRVASELAATLGPGDVIALHGELGSGKTCFVQGIAKALGVQHGVTSPTFKLISEYPGTIKLYHVDLYRLRGESDARDLGLDEYLFGDGITAIEWAERLAHLLPARTIHVRMAAGADEKERSISISSGDSP
jgi:tRNA threonylcarbamoyladenosine biosynthesis protein TsaE